MVDKFAFVIGFLDVRISRCGGWYVAGLIDAKLLPLCKLVCAFCCVRYSPVCDGVSHQHSRTGCVNVMIDFDSRKIK